MALKSDGYPVNTFNLLSALLIKTFVTAGILICFPVIAAAQAGSSPTVAPPPASAGDDSDPTRPVAWSLREEYYNLPGQSWNNAFLFRVDRAVLKDRPRPLGKKGILTRVDIPFIVAHRADGTSAGLGDIYAQALLLPYLTRKFAFAAGSGISLPTATDRRLGTGKLTIAPAAAPVWFIPKRGFFFVKVQDYFSVAGAGGRPDLHYMTVTPLLVWRLKGKPYWIQLDAETQTNWKADGHTGYKAGFLFGRMTKKRTGAWIKVEVGMGPYRVQSLAIKTSIFKVR
jgi:hypothetical protein